MASYDRTLDLDWQDLFGPVQPVTADANTLVRVEREVIPIVFVPGIMGSRLKRMKEGPNRIGASQELGLAWEPEIETDATSFSAYFTKGQYRGVGRTLWLARRFFRASAAKRKALIIGRSFDPSYLQVLGRDERGNPDESDREHAAASADVPGAYERGWVGVSMASYGTILRHLTDRTWSEPIRHCFDLPVHAYGYNWTESNARSGSKLAAHVGTLIDGYVAEGRRCERVILVSHSMGGLVSRAAARELGMRGVEAILGVVHGAQPASGAPNAYWRMKAGFAQRGISLMLGKNAAEVTALLGHMPGGLQLLPNKRYRALRDGRLSSRWMHYPSPADGSTVERPQTGNPYTEIYLAREPFYRLCDASLLDPDDHILSDPALARVAADPKRARDFLWNLYAFHIRTAETFQDDHQDYAHPRTYQFYGTGLATLSQIEYTRTEDTVWNTLKARTAHRLGWGWTPPIFRGSEEDAANTRNYRARVLPDGGLYAEAQAALVADGQDADALAGSDLYLMTLQHADGVGDTTVPDSSGAALQLPDSYTVAITEAEESNDGARGHEPIFQSRTARHVTAMAIENLLLGLIGREGGTGARVVPAGPTIPRRRPRTARSAPTTTPPSTPSRRSTSSGPPTVWTPKRGRAARAPSGTRRGWTRATR